MLATRKLAVIFESTLSYIVTFSFWDEIKKDPKEPNDTVIRGFHLLAGEIVQ
jgi:hypothetical protein